MGCAPALNNSDDDDLASDDDDLASDDDDLASDDDDAVGDDDDDTPMGRGAVTFTGSFGMCGGECVFETSVDPMFEEGRLTTQGWDGQIFQSRWGSLSPDGLDLLLEMTDSVDPTDLEPVYGCPDCDDGGAREIMFDLGPVLVTTAYEYGNPPPILEELDWLLTAFEQELLTCAYGTWFWSIPDCDPVDGGGPVPG